MHPMRVASGGSRLQALAAEVDRAFTAHMLEGISGEGYTDVGAGMAALVQALDVADPTPACLLPSRLGISKQGVSQLLRQLGSRGVPARGGRGNRRARADRSPHREGTRPAGRPQ